MNHAVTKINNLIDPKMLAQMLNNDNDYSTWLEALAQATGATVYARTIHSNCSVTQAIEELELISKSTYSTRELYRKVQSYDERQTRIKQEEAKRAKELEEQEQEKKRIRDNKQLREEEKLAKLSTLNETEKSTKMTYASKMSKITNMSDRAIRELPSTTEPKPVTSKKGDNQHNRDKKQYKAQVQKQQANIIESDAILDCLDESELTATHIAIVKRARATYPYMKQWKIGMAIVAVANYAHHPEIQELNNPTVEEVIKAKEAYTRRMTAETSRTIEERTEDTERIAERDKQRKQEALDSMPSHAQLVRNNRRATHTLKPFEYTRGDVIKQDTAKDIVKSLLAIGLTDEDMQVVAKEMCKKQTVTDIIAQLKKIELTNADTKRLIKAVTP